MAVLQHGRIIYQRGYGSKQLGVHDPLSSRTVFNIGSVSKQFTAFCLLLLQDEGRLKLSDSACKHFPEWPKRFAPIKLSHLMHHSSGLPTLEDLLWSQWKVRPDKPGGRTTVRMMARQRLVNFEPGGEFCYNNDGYVLLAEVIKRRSGLSLPDFARQRIFEPLKMHQSRILESGSTYVPEKVTGYRKVKGKVVLAPKEFYTPGSGDLWTSFEDLAKWERNFYDPQVGSPAVFAAMHARARYKRQLAGNQDYGGGLAFWKEQGLQFEGHDGGDSGALTEYHRCPSLGLAVLFATNNEAVGLPHAPKVFAALLGWKPERKPRALKLPSSYKSSAGYYENDRALWQLQPAAKGLKAQINGGKTVFVHIGRGHFAQPSQPGIRLKLAKDAKGVWSLKVTFKGKLRRHLSHVGRSSAVVPGMRALAGTYRHAESGYIHQLKVVGKRLYFVDPHWTVDAKTLVESLGPDHLILPGMAFFVQRDVQGKVLALNEWEPGGRNMRLRMIKVK